MEDRALGVVSYLYNSQIPFVANSLREEPAAGLTTGVVILHEEYLLQV